MPEVGARESFYCGDGGGAGYLPARLVAECGGAAASRARKAEDPFGAGLGPPRPVPAKPAPPVFDVSQIVGVLGSTRYSFTVPGERVRVNKVVHHYLMEAQGGDVSLHDEEHDVVDWVDVREARRLLTYAAQRDIVDRASVLIANRAEDEAADG